jgi:NAD(P)-dependent dehydrogenase (short-subunit alcohol dehydrogenase family)
LNRKPEVVVITGASAGVGRATVRAFAKRGAHIGLLARGQDGLDGARKEVAACGGCAIALPTDVADAAAVGKAAAAVEEKFGPIDIWINNAMTSVFAPVTEIKPEEFKRVTEVSYLGFVYGTMEALKRMLPRNRGTIIQVGSALAYRSIPLQSAYCGSKHAIVGFTDSLRCELIHEGSEIKLTVVHMPALNTPQFDWVKNRLPHKAQPVPPIFQPEVAAEAITWAADHPRREIWVSASTYKAIVGQRLVPGLLDLYLARTNYQAQQHDGPADPNRPDDLWEPVKGDAGAHGSFDDRAHSKSWALKLTQYRRWLAAAAVILAGAIRTVLRNERT